MASDKNLIRTVLTDPVHFLAFGFGTGLAPFAPGTWGSLPAIVIWWFAPKDLLTQSVLLAVGFAVGVWLCGASSKKLGVHDHSGIVWDEIVGMYLVLMVLPVSMGPEPAWILGAFALFRLFDIWKPWPIRELDHSLRGGLGIMLDDVVAALYAALILVILQKFVF